jgi:hypothetical protein
MLPPIWSLLTENSRASSVHDLLRRQKIKWPSCGAILFSRRVWLRMSTLFDQRDRVAVSWRGGAAGATQSHPFRENNRMPLGFFFSSVDLRLFDRLCRNA